MKRKNILTASFNNEDVLTNLQMVKTKIESENCMEEFSQSIEQAMNWKKLNIPTIFVVVDC